MSGSGDATGRRSGQPPLATPRLRELAAGRPPGPEADGAPEAAEDGAGEGAGPRGTCDMCSEPIGPRHGHVVDLRERTLMCACRPCSILFDEGAAGGEHYRLVPSRVRRLEAFELDEMDWVALRIPVDLAFFFYSTPAERVMALYPGPMGATESRLTLEHWERIEERNPALSGMEPDVEALLVNRTGERNEGWLVPIDTCYELVGLFRTRWKGLSGGREVWEAIEDFFDDLRRRAS